MLLLDKPEGPTSHDVVDAVRHALAVRRVGHAGTLDPFASGLLLVLVGASTRLARFMTSFTKTYRGTIRLGVATDTDDCTGEPIGTSETWREVSDGAISEAMAGFLGVHRQRPPAYSAKKVSGKRAYRLARAGKDVELAATEVTIHDFGLLARRESAVQFEARVGGGTYIRALARDLGERLGCGAHLARLRRTAIGPFTVEEAAPLTALAEQGRDLVRPPLRAVEHLPQVHLVEDQRSRVIHGQPLEMSAPEGDVIALVSDAQLVAVAEREGTMLKPRVVLADG